MDCPRCEAHNAPDARFCEECGARLTLSCPSCGASVVEGKKFCRACGTALSPITSQQSGRFSSPQSYTPKHLAERILTSRAALEGERKQVTVLFADLKGSMELLADRDPEEARKLLDPVLERMMEAVHRYEGTVNQVMGDGIMALFGAPLAHEDHAVRACYAALRMQQAIARYADELRRAWALDVQIRVGMNSGEVVVRSVGSDLRMDYTAVGQTTHLAARMEQLARPGTVLLASQTLTLVEGYVQVRALGAMPIRGLSEPVEVFELVGAGGARTRLQAAATRGLTQFVGRQRELEILGDALISAGQGKGQAVAIVGEPGVGKSRMFWEFLRSHRTQGWLTVEAGSVSYGKATPYLPVIDLLKVYFKIGDRDDARAIREKATGKLLTLDRALEAILSALLALLDQPVDDVAWQGLDPPLRRRRTLEALERLWLREAQAQPLILVFEDLHWIDTETQEFLDRLIERIPTHPILLLFNYRPEYHHTWGNKTYYTQLRLDPLSTATAETLLHSLLGSDPGLAPLRHLLIERTEGNPFFLEESVRMLVETGAVAGERGNYLLVRPSTISEVPATVQSILAARIDRLSVEHKRLLQTSAVVGKDVPFTLLQAVADMSEDKLQTGLASLQAAEFLYETSLFPDLEYTFKHALTHDVAYGSLLQDRRRALHAQIVEAIETLHGGRLDEQVEKLAHHALHAELWDRALRSLRQAAKKASARSAFREAARYLELALSVMERLPDRDAAVKEELDIRFDLRVALLPAAQFARIAEVLEGAVVLAERIGDRGRLAWAHAYVAFSALELLQQAKALESGRLALALSEENGEPVSILTARHYLSQIHHTMGEYSKAIEIGRPATQYNDDLVSSALAKGNIGVIPHYLMRSQAEVGHFAESLSNSEAALRLAEDAAHPLGLSLVCVGLGYAHVRSGFAEKAIPVLERSLELCRTYALDIQIPWTTSTLGLAYALAGQLAAGVANAEEAVWQSDDRRIPRYQPLRLSILANVYLLAGRIEDAHATAEKALKLARDYHEKGPEAWSLYLLGESDVRSDSTLMEHARQRYLDAMQKAEELSMRPLVAHCRLGLGKLYLALGDISQARTQLERALSLYREMQMHRWPTQAEDALRNLGQR